MYTTQLVFQGISIIVRSRKGQPSPVTKDAFHISTLNVVTIVHKSC